MRMEVYFVVDSNSILQFDSAVQKKCLKGFHSFAVIVIFIKSKILENMEKYSNFNNFTVWS